MMDDLINKWETMRALQAINPVAKLMDGDVVIRISEVENVLEHMPSAEQEAPDINVGSIDTTDHDSNVVKKGGNDEDRTSGDCVSRQAVKDIFTELYGISAIGSVFDKYEWADICETTANELPSVQPDVIRCKGCKYYKYGICMKIGANKSFHGFCDWAERREDG